MVSDGKSLKSSFDLAMERLAQRDGKVARLTDAQKAAVSEEKLRTLEAAIAKLALLKNNDLRGKLEAFRAEQTAAARAMTLPPAG